MIEKKLELCSFFQETKRVTREISFFFYFLLLFQNIVNEPNFRTNKCSFTIQLRRYKCSKINRLSYIIKKSEWCQKLQYPETAQLQEESKINIALLSQQNYGYKKEKQETSTNSHYHLR